MSNSKRTSWRDVLPIHPAADFFDPMTPDELRTLGEDIKANGLRNPLAFWIDPQDGRRYLLDGRNRANAMEMVGIDVIDGKDGYCHYEMVEGDPYAYVVSANIQRRHLTADDKRRIIAALIKAKPERSDLAISKLAKTHDKAVTKVRREMEGRSEIPNVSTKVDTKGRRQPAARKAKPRTPERDPVAATDDNTSKGLAIPGIAAHAHDERGLDLYQTPPEATRALLTVGHLDHNETIWEPACGPGAIVKVLREAGHHVIATDFIDYGCPGALGGVDFLRQIEPPKGAQVIVTNPPFKHADEFVRHALTMVPKVVMLLRLAFLESEGRGDILDGGQLESVLVFRNRLPMMHRAGWDGPRSTSAIAFAWFVWNRDHQGSAELERISWEAAAPPVAAEAGDHLGIPGFLRREATP